MAKDDLSSLSVEELETLQTELAEQRTAIRLQQNAVAAELELRKALGQLSPNALEHAQKLGKQFYIRLEGGITPEGEATVEETTS